MADADYYKDKRKDLLAKWTAFLRSDELGSFQSLKSAIVQAKEKITEQLAAVGALTNLSPADQAKMAQVQEYLEKAQAVIESYEASLNSMNLIIRTPGATATLELNTNNLKGAYQRLDGELNSAATNAGANLPVDEVKLNEAFELFIEPVKALSKNKKDLDTMLTGTKQIQAALAKLETTSKKTEYSALLPKTPEEGGFLQDVLQLTHSLRQTMQRAQHIQTPEQYLAEAYNLERSFYLAADSIRSMLTRRGRITNPSFNSMMTHLQNLERSLGPIYNAVSNARTVPQGDLDRLRQMYPQKTDAEYLNLYKLEQYRSIVASWATISALEQDAQNRVDLMRSIR